MRNVFLILMCAGLLAGCATALPPQRPADSVKITTLLGHPELPRKEVREKDRIAMLLSFVNSLPNRWSLPWYGRPVGQVYFEFYSGEKFIGNFYVGPMFFGRDGGGEFWSRPASKAKIEELGRIVGLDLWTYINEKKP